MWWCEVVARSLDLYVEYLTPAVHAVGRVDSVGAEASAVLRIGGKLRECEGDRTATFAAALLRLFAFWLTHRMKVRNESDVRG